LKKIGAIAINGAMFYVRGEPCWKTEKNVKSNAVTSKKDFWPMALGALAI